MNIQRFTAPTAREALSKARMTFGDGTLILSNRPTASGVEVVATGEETLDALDRNDQQARQGQRQLAAKTAPALTANPDSQVIEDTAQLAMSTLSFQDYVRERMLRKRHEAIAAQTAAPAMPERQERPAAPRAPVPVARAASLQPGIAPIQVKKVAPRAPAPAPVSVAVSAAPSQGIVDELQAMKALIEDRFNTLTWLGQARQNPIHANLMLKLIRSGYSPALARTIMERMPEDLNAAAATHWVIEVLTRNLRTDAGSSAIHDEGGTYALVGATGVGKTTTAAKLAGLCARTHGPASVGLITLDTYRVGAHEQLRTYGRMLGVVAHLAHDRAALQDLLGLLSNKKMVLIDTTGIAPNDPRKRDMMDLLDLPDVHRLLVLNAGGHGDTLDDMISAFKTTGMQQTILSKTDEAAKIGPALDATIRHQLVLRGVTTGQKVPEDWERADAANLIAMSMRSPAKSAFDPKVADLGFFFAQSSPMQPGQFHA
ncbi:flagellar biosynthesis protein FlhF [Rhodoferax antarcticus]|uniref:flagellar biosynthesis protein FlhF n=1 Tax=Rhodoferax antarcticus TaxID=81479 RepID=UPI0022240686|nr:flagellar biosynthesis protein FlhF [Rhodoferax antarcticus]MCW2312818.1 flagellar biosynthesis protein FlhF [Rhodoferax antarcticus]